jgi:high-affinity iron transporter
MIRRNLVGILLPVTVLASVLSSWVAAATAPKQTPEMLQKGKALYQAQCLTCHGASGAGDGETAAYLTQAPGNFKKGGFKKGDQPGKVFQSVSEGNAAAGMPAFDKLPETDRWALVYYVLSLRK